MEQVSIYISHNINTVRAKDGMYGIVLEGLNAKGEKKTKEFFGHLAKCTINRAEVRTLIEALKKLKRSCNLTIYTEHDYLIKGVEWCQTWQQNNWETQKGTPVANKEEWQECLCLLNTNEVSFVKGEHEFSKWIKSEIERKKV
jgi:ribonuclease HI